jgi:hypothetical protein
LPDPPKRPMSAIDPHTGQADFFVTLYYLSL